MAGRTRWESFGNTRRPKTLSTVEGSAAPGGTLETARVVTISAAGDLAAALDSATEGQNGYATENQRFLHVLVKTNNGKSVTIYGYNYAFGEWAPLQHRVDSDNAAAVYADMAATTGSSGEAKLYIFDIAGMDRVAFVTADAPGVVKAACSSF